MKRRQSDIERYEAAGGYRLSDMKPGYTYVMHYNDTNKGRFVWFHSHVEGEDAYGQIQEIESWECSDVDSYLYEYEGYLCCGSGAEVVCREMPEDPVFDEEDE